MTTKLFSGANDTLHAFWDKDGNVVIQVDHAIELLTCDPLAKEECLALGEILMNAAGATRVKGGEADQVKALRLQEKRNRVDQAAALIMASWPVLSGVEIEIGERARISWANAWRLEEMRV